MQKCFFVAHRLMFWSDWGVNGRIESAYMDGTGRHALVDTMVQWPTGLTVDYPARRLYWTDPKAYTIESVDLNGQDRQVIKRFPHSKSEYHDMILKFTKEQIYGFIYFTFFIQTDL
jgi:integrin beta 2